MSSVSVSLARVLNSDFSGHGPEKQIGHQLVNTKNRPASLPEAFVTSVRSCPMRPSFPWNSGAMVGGASSIRAMRLIGSQRARQSFPREASPLATKSRGFATAT